MTDLSWLAELPADDPAFAPLHRAAELDPEDFLALSVTDGACGYSLGALDAHAEGMRTTAARMREQDMRLGGPNPTGVHAAEIAALGYALGVTAVRVAIREHDEQPMAVAA